ncbi:predicted protein, partial [Arabidopsis lyrata subsp. lyrata]
DLFRQQVVVFTGSEHVGKWGCCRELFRSEDYGEGEMSSSWLLQDRGWSVKLR